MGRYLFSYNDSERGSVGVYKAVIQANNLTDAKRIALQTLGYKRSDFPEEEVSSWEGLWKELKLENEEGMGGYIDIKPIQKGRWLDRDLVSNVTVTNYAGRPVEPLPRGTGPYYRDYED